MRFNLAQEFQCDMKIFGATEAHASAGRDAAQMGGMLGGLGLPPGLF